MRANFSSLYPQKKNEESEFLHLMLEKREEVWSKCLTQEVNKHVKEKEKEYKGWKVTHFHFE
jgi:hypothetical protein